MAFFDMPLEELRRYAPPLTREADFDAFWERTLAEAARTPLDLRLTPLELPYRNAKLYRASFAGWGGAEIAGTYATPLGDGPFPAIAIYHGHRLLRSKAKRTVETRETVATPASSS